MSAIQPIDLVTGAAGILSLIGTMGVARIQFRGQKSQQRDERVARLEDSLSALHAQMSEQRERHFSQVERLMGEEEDLRDTHAVKMNTERERSDGLRVQITVLRAELLRRGVNPDRCTFDDSVGAPKAGVLADAAGVHQARRSGDRGGESPPVAGGRRDSDPPLVD